MLIFPLDLPSFAALRETDLVRSRRQTRRLWRWQLFELHSQTLMN